MKKGKWFYYWKKVQGRISASDYIFFSEENKFMYEDEDNLKDHCEDWASRVNQDGLNSRFEYGFDDIETPPKQWVDKKIKSVKEDINILQENLDRLQNLYTVNA